MDKVDVHYVYEYKTIPMSRYVALEKAEQELADLKALVRELIDEWDKDLDKLQQSIGGE